jgi:rfaE bifunctional protein nucleotidyltransferase chain/domain
MASTPPLATKILARDSLLAALAARRASGQRVVLTNGCFDLLHVGHVRYLGSAAQLADILVVGVNTDASVRALKPGRPLVPAEQRAEVVAALGCVDFVTLFDEPTAEQLVRAVRPEVYVKGGDYAEQTPPEALAVRELGGRFQTLDLVAGVSTSELARRLCRADTSVAGA